MAPSGPSALWRREVAEAEKRVRAYVDKALARALFDGRMTDHRTPRDFSVVPQKVSRHATDNSQRAINDRLMLGTDVVDRRSLAGGEVEAGRDPGQHAEVPRVDSQ